MHRLFWEKCAFDIGLKGVFTFDFGKTFVDDVPWGDLQSFDFGLDGYLNIDLLLKYAITAGFEKGDEALIKENLLRKPLVFKFMVGAVPVIIFVDAHLYGRYSVEAEVALSAGCNIRANASMGFSVIKHSWTDFDVTPVTSFTPTLTPYFPAITAKGSLKAKHPFIRVSNLMCIEPHARG